VTDPAPGSTNGKPVGTLVSELAGMVVAYFRQETVDPFKSLGRYLILGFAGALLLALGFGLLALTAVRLVQAETGRHLRGDLTWVPYTGGFLVAAVGSGWALLHITRNSAQK
jgi:hypothetical protein